MNHGWAQMHTDKKQKWGKGGTVITVQYQYIIRYITIIISNKIFRLSSLDLCQKIPKPCQIVPFPAI